MGKAARWLRGLFNIKRPDPNPNPNPTSNKPSSKDKRNKWSFVKSYKEKPTDVPATDPKPSLVGPTTGVDDASKHAIAVAAATAAVAEAAVAAAHAAAAVVRLTSGGTCSATPTMQVQVSYGGDEERYVRAALLIQSYFRTYLARRALRALKGLVKLQALVRGHIMRKKTKETMRCMQAMLRAQARARSVRASFPESPQSSTKSSSQNQHPGPPTPEKFELVHAKSAKHDQTPKIRRNGSRTSWSNIVNTDKGNLGSSWSDPRTDEPTWDYLRGGSSTRTCPTDDERADRILEVDPGKPFFNIRRRNLFQSSYSGLLNSDHISHSYTTSKDSTHLTVPSPVSYEAVQSLNPLKLSQEIEDGLYCTAENSPQLYSSGSQGGGSRKGLFTPAKSDGSRSFLSGYSDCPSYMAYTESAKAKMRSHSAPKQRPQYERTSSTKRYSVHGFGEHNPRSHAQRGSAMQTSFTSKAYPGSGRLDRLGMPVRDSTVVYYSGYLN